MRLDPSVLIAGDAFFGFLAAGAIAPWLSSSHEQNRIVVEAAAAATGAFVVGGYASVYEGVLGPWFVSRFLDAAKVDFLDYAVLLPSEETCVARVATRADHEFTDEAATRKMHRGFAARQTESRHVIRSDDQTVEETVESLIERLGDGRLRVQRSS